MIGFFPMYLAGGFGIEFPLIGFPELDTSYSSSGWVQMSHLMTGCLMIGAALSEIRGEMSLATFMHYHWALSLALLKWQLGPTSTTLGSAMFLLPHFFTLWSTAMYVGGKGETKNKKTR
ncbi:hypothetical protein TrCOL_g836 [Triparma columacea]|uniref:Uncharacterized protein n=1 Tax=Triparma columacea TaxID=722753 RepID=A0A9W7G431_9STRA|nr:hypothetical protein TrCOL_g836 [Triparma columacea]